MLVLKNRSKWGSCRVVSDAILSGLVMHDFLGTAPNPGYKPNSLLYGSNFQSAYNVCDPRLASEEDDFDESAPGAGIDRFGDNNPSIPAKYRLFKSPKGQERSNLPFNFALYNSTGLVAFENTAVNSYMNPILLLFYFLKDIKNEGLCAQVSPYHQRSPNTLWCELGLLFHMMNLLSQSAESNIPKVVTANNFQISFRQLPEVLALGLMETHSSDSNDSYQLIQKFTKFIFSQLQRETEVERKEKMSVQDSSESASNPIRDLFNFTGVTTTTFLKSGTEESSTSTEFSTLELVYPFTTAPKAQGGGYVKRFSSFASVIHARYVVFVFQDLLD